jgi:inorganic pyrophosphatase
MDQVVKVYIEIEQHSNHKYELNKETGKLELDRMLPYPFFYPYAYGFIENTIAMDDDELDAIIISNNRIDKDTWCHVYIIGVLIMEDEKGLDEKVLCVFEEDYYKYKDITDLPQEIKDNIIWFFTNYKTKTPNKWTKVTGFENKNFAIQLWKDYRLLV